MLERLSDLFLPRGVPDHLRSDNGPVFAATMVRDWLDNVGVKTMSLCCPHGLSDNTSNVGTARLRFHQPLFHPPPNMPEFATSFSSGAVVAG